MNASTDIRYSVTLFMRNFCEKTIRERERQTCQKHQYTLFFGVETTF